VKLTVKHIPFLYLFTLLAGTLFFIPAVFVSRFTTAPALWTQAGISVGIIGYVLMSKEPIPVPKMGFILLIAIWATHHIWQSQGNIENMATIITLMVVFFLFYAIWPRLKDKKLLFALFAFLALTLSLWGLGQFAGLFPSYNGSFAVTGPFDNPAGISASLVVLLPFSLYYCRYPEKKYRLFAIISACLVVTAIVLSQARAAILATVVIFILFFIRLLKERDIRFSFVHYTVITLCCLLFLAGLFFIKKDSASGRLLIRRCSVQLIVRKPVFGYGGNGFTANYMNEQASYFTKHPDSKYAMLADNVRHPFDEFLKWTINYGMAGLYLTLLLVVIPLWISRKKDSSELFSIRASLLAIGVCGLFSYPFNYPFIRLMTAVFLAFALAANSQQGITIPNGYLSKGVVVLFSIGLLCATAYQAFHEHEWHKIAHRSLRGETASMLPLYKSLYTHLHHKDLFLYNYAAELNVTEHYKESQQIARECDNIWADYDLHMLMADNCRQLQQYGEAENYLKKAAAMCPVKFMPLYRLTELYLETGRKEDAQVVAQKIMDKKIKIPSPIIKGIKNKMRNLLNELDSLNDSSQINKFDTKSTMISSGQNHLLDSQIPRALLPT